MGVAPAYSTESRGCHYAMERLEERLLLTTFFVDDSFTAGELDATHFNTIQGAIDAASANDEIIVADGLYIENILINKTLTLLSENGRDSTIIEGIEGVVGVYGTIRIAGGVNNVQIGDIDQGFTVIGFDVANPGQEGAAIYFLGNHNGAKIIGNDIVANGEHGLLTLYGLTVSNFTIDNNIFSGQTYVGDHPEGGNQFVDPNVARQLVVMGAGAGTTSTTNIVFTNNTIVGSTGGVDDNGVNQGNTLVTIDATGLTVTGNTFAGETTKGNALRARGNFSTIEDNTFDSTDMGDDTNFVFLGDPPSADPATVVANNTFDQVIIVNPDGSVSGAGPIPPPPPPPLAPGGADVLASARGSKLMLSVGDASLASNLDIDFINGGVVITGLNGTTINGETTVTIANVSTLAGKLGDGTDTVTVSGNVKKFNLDLGEGSNTLNLVDFIGDATAKVDSKDGSLTFNAVDSDFSRLKVQGGKVGNDVINLDSVNVSGRTQIKLFHGDNDLFINDSSFDGAFTFSSRGSATTINVESNVADGTGTDFNGRVSVNIGPEAVINLATDPLADDVSFDGRVRISASTPAAVINLDDVNVSFKSNPRLRNASIV